MNPEDVTRLRQQSSDDSVMQYLYEQDAGFKQAVDNVRTKNPDMSPFEKAKFPAAMLDMHYKPKTPQPKNVNPLTTQMMGAAMERHPQAIGPTLGGFTMDSPGGHAVQGAIDQSPLLQDIGSIANKGINDAATGLNEAAADYGAGRRSLPGAIFKGGAEVAGGTARVLGAPVEAVLQEPVKLLSNSIDQNPGLLGPLLGWISGKASEFAASHPDAAEIAQSTAKWASLPMAMASVEPTIDSVGKPLESIGKAFAAPDPAKLKSKLDAVVGQIVQGDKDSIKTATKALQEIDPQGIKTYDDLAATAKSNVQAMSAKQDELLSAYPDKHPLDTLTKTIKVGEKSADTNAVRDALNHLDELYTKTGRTEDALRIQNMRDSAEGLTLKEMNDVAREYGAARSGFSPKTGEPLTSVNSQMYENTRKGIKQVVRDMLPDDTSKMLDLATSDQIALEDLAKKVSGKVQQLQNKIQARGLGNKIGRALGKAVDMASFGTWKGFISSSLPSNVGLKQLNYLEIQNALAKNLTKFNTLIREVNALPDEQAAQTISKFMKSAMEPIEQATEGAAKAGVASASSK